MSTTNSIAFPKMFDVARNRVSVIEGPASITNRSRLLILTEPTELYMNLDFGVGLKRHLWQYKNDNVKAIIKDRIVEQLRLHEPCVTPEDTQVSDGLMFTGDGNTILAQDANKLKMTVALSTIFGDKSEFDLMQEEIFGSSYKEAE